jgi:hypothetical protein
MEPLSQGEASPQARRSVKQILHSYFFWTYPRGCFHYDVLVTLILLFIFIAPQLWDFGDKPSIVTGPQHPMQVVGTEGRGMIVTVMASDANVPADASEKAVKKALRKAIEPVTGDAVVVERWETVTDAEGNIAWKVWAHR